MAKKNFMVCWGWSLAGWREVGGVKTKSIGHLL